MTAEEWHQILQRGSEGPPPPLWAPLIAPSQRSDGMFLLGRLAQSLDGFIAMPNGEARWISGQDDLVHTHRLRALFDAVVVGAGTIRADNPQLTTRLVTGPNPVRVVIDPELRLGADWAVFQGGPETLVFRAEGVPGTDRIGTAQVLTVPRGLLGLDIAAMLSLLHARGLRRIFVEGGGITVSKFLLAGALDRLHVTVAPLLIGTGIPALSLPLPRSLAEGKRFVWSVHPMGEDVLLDIALSDTR